MNDLLDTLLRGARECPSCGTGNLRSDTHCRSCGERIRNRNPLVRLAVTVIALAVMGFIVWYTSMR